jgi:MFS transporter, FHS family, glucose/mannose:H+ symporter
MFGLRLGITQVLILDLFLSPMRLIAVRRYITMLASRLPLSLSVSLLFFIVGIFYHSVSFAIWDAPFTLSLSDTKASELLIYRNVSFTSFTGDAREDITWGLGYYFILPLTVISSLIMFLSQIRSGRSNFSFFDIRRLYGNLLHYSVNPLVMITLLSVLLLGFIHLHFTNWVDDFSGQLVDMGEWQFFRQGVDVVILLSFAVSLLLSSFLLRKIGYWFLFSLYLVLLGGAIIYVEKVLGGTELVAALTMEQLSPAFFFIPVIAFLLSPLFVLLYSSIAVYAQTDLRLSLLTILFFAYQLGKIYLKELSAFFYKNFIGYVAFYFSLIPIALLLVLFLLNYFDLRRKNQPRSTS